MNTQGVMELLEAYTGDDKAFLSRKICKHPLGRANILKMNLPSIQNFLVGKGKSTRRVLTEEEENKEVIKRRVAAINTEI